MGKRNKQKPSGKTAKRPPSAAAPASTPPPAKPKLVKSGRKPGGSKSFAELWMFLAITALFFASGLSSLIYQVVWTRILVLVFGATTFATSTVLAVFMGGLALGSFVAGRLSDRIKRPLLWYGILEAIIGVWALLTPALFTAATPIYKLIWQHTHASLIPFSLLRFGCASAILIVPTTCMGASLPLLARHVTARLSEVGNRVGTLYAVNTLGAVAGAALAGFTLLPGFGLNISIYIGAAINILLLTGVLLLTRFVPGIESGAVSETAVTESSRLAATATGTTGTGMTGTGMTATAAADTASSKTKLSRPVVVALGAFAVSGAIAMMYEVCWTRTLLMVIGSSTYAFTVMLCAFLVGIFLGSLICARLIDRSKQPLLWFAGLQMMLGVLTLISMHDFNYLPYWNITINAACKFDEDMLMFVRFLLAGSVLVPVTLCLGAIFPAVVKACTRDLSAVGRSVGSLYAANTLGAICGAFLAGFVCLPIFGAEKTLLYGAFVNTGLGIILLWAACEGSAKNKLKGTAIGVSAVALLACFSGGWDHVVLLTVQAARRTLAYGTWTYKSFEEWRNALHKNYDVEFWADGPCSNVGVLLEQKKVTALVTNGHVDGSDDADMPVQVLLSGFPLLLKPDAKDVAVIGWGCGQTVGTATLFPVRSIEAVELEPSVIEASKFFHRLNHVPEKDPRVHIRFNDGRNYLLATDQKFDVIVSEPSNPWQAGVCNLFTREYFKVCRDRLNDNGLLSVWLQTAEVPPSDVCVVLNALNKTFKYTMVFYPRPGNTVILASQQPLTIDIAKIEALLKDKSRGDEFSRVGIKDPETMISHIAVASDGLKSFLATSVVNSDDRNLMEFDVGKSYESKVYLRNNTQLLAAMSGSPWEQVAWGTLAPSERSRRMTEIANDCISLENNVLAEGWAQRAIKVQPNMEAYRLLGLLQATRGDYKAAGDTFDQALAMNPDDAEVLLLRASLRTNLNKRDLAHADFERVLQLKPGDKKVRYMYALSYKPYLLGGPFTKQDYAKHLDANTRKVLGLLGDLPDDSEFVKERPAILLIAAQANLKVGNLDKADKYAKQLSKTEPNSKLVKQLVDDIASARSAPAK